MMAAEYGSVFIEYETDELGESALKGMHGRTYDGRIVRTVFIPESLWNGDLKLRHKKV